MGTRLTYETLHGWPKAELHCHLDGSVRPTTLLDIAADEGKLDLLPADSPEGLVETLKQIDDAGSLVAYLSWFSVSIPLLQTRRSLRRAAYELVETASQENVVYLEVRYSPVLHVEEGLSFEEINDAVLDGLQAASTDFGVRTNLIICGLRDRPESTSLRLAELASSYFRRGVVGFDLAGAEAGYPPKQHLHAFYHARNNLLNLTIHAGESWGPESIHQALFRCGAHRIGHGTTLIRDEALLEYVVDHQIPLEICPTCNVQTGVVDILENHPLKKYVEAGAAVTINTDNRLFSQTSLTQELWRVFQECDLTEEQMRSIVLDGFKHSFLHWEERRDMVNDMTSKLTPVVRGDER
jgi:adenosine deaminase